MASEEPQFAEKYNAGLAGKKDIAACCRFITSEVRKMREAQQNYFRTRRKGYLDYSRSLEKQVDAELKDDTPKLF